jgi:hypothetical protein
MDGPGGRPPGALHRGIHHPQENTKFRAGFLVAYGLVPAEAGTVQATLFDADDNQVMDGTLYQPAPAWIAIFEDVPAAGPLTLRLTSESGYVLGECRGLWGLFPPRMTDMGGPWIGHPVSGDSVAQSNPVAYGGSSAGTTSITGTLSGAGSATGTLYPSGNWVMNFPAFTPSPTVITTALSVTDNQGGNAGSSPVYAQPG